MKIFLLFLGRFEEFFAGKRMYEEVGGKRLFAKRCIRFNKMNRTRQNRVNSSI